MRIGMDIDGVVYDWTAQYRRFVGAILNKRDLPEIEEWSFYKKWGITTPEFHSHLSEYPIEIYGMGHHISGAKAGLRRLQEAGHRVYAVTARPREAIPTTYAWLTSWGFVWDGIVIGDDKAQLSTDVVVDDGPHNVEALLTHGHNRVIVFDQKWNRHVDAERVCSWPELVETLND